MTKFSPLSIPPEIPVAVPPDVPQEGLTTNTIVTVKVPGFENRIGIRQADWDRLKRKLNKCNTPLPNINRIVDLSLGIFISTILTSLSLYLGDTKLDLWVYAVLVCLIIFSLILACAFHIMGISEAKRRRGDIAEIELEMQEIESNIRE
jgi:hypothetical protein